MAFFSKKSVALFGVLGSLCYLFQNYTVDGLQHLTLRPVPTQSTPLSNAVLVGSLDGTNLSVAEKFAVVNAPQPDLPLNRVATIPVAVPGPAHSQALLHFASFNLNKFGAEKANRPRVMDIIAKVCQPFDVVAIQGVASQQQDIVPRLIDKLNQNGKVFDYLIGPRVGRTDNKEQFVFLFNTATIETDRNQLYTVDDRHELLEHEPLVGWFRARGVPTDQAFTFTLINVHLDANRTQEEVRILPELVRTVQLDGRKEDDVILLGDFNASDRQLQFLQNQGMTFAISGKATNMRGTFMLDNFVFPSRATDEFTGKAGVIDFLREQNLSLDNALEISDHLPLWAEFYAVEGGQRGRIAQ